MRHFTANDNDLEKKPCSFLFLEGIAMVVGLAFFCLFAVGYSPFPGLEDYAAIPVILAHFDPALYRTDIFVQNVPFHFPLYSGIVFFLYGTVGLPYGIFVLTVLVTCLIFLALYLLARAAGFSGVFLPVSAMIGLCGGLTGLGFGAYYGLIGPHFNAQILAMCCALFSYVFFLRGKALFTGILLGFSALSHPAIGLHALIILLFSGVLLPLWRWRQIGILIFAAVLVGGAGFFPYLVSIFSGITHQYPFSVAGNHLWRSSHEHIISAEHVRLYLLVVVTGWMGFYLVFWREKNNTVLHAIGLLMLGHSLLAVAAGLLFGPWQWVNRISVDYPSWLFDLSLTQSTPLLLALSGLMAGMALETVSFDALRKKIWRPDIGVLLFWLVFGAALGTLAFVQMPHNILPVVVLLTLFSWAAWKICWPRPGIMALIWVFSGLFFFGWNVLHSPISETVDPKGAQLYKWIEDHTDKDALFITPPGHHQFRYETKRGTVADFSLFPAGDSGLIALWGEKMEEISDPDLLARRSRGWSGIFEWDRTYASRNTPERVQYLLKNLGADYFLWDTYGLKIPPFVVRDRTLVEGLDIVFQNDRYILFKLSTLSQRIREQ